MAVLQGIPMRCYVRLSPRPRATPPKPTQSDKASTVNRTDGRRPPPRVTYPRPAVRPARRRPVRRARHAPRAFSSTRRTGGGGSAMTGQYDAPARAATRGSCASRGVLALTRHRLVVGVPPDGSRRPSESLDLLRRGDLRRARTLARRRRVVRCAAKPGCTRPWASSTRYCSPRRTPWRPISRPPTRAVKVINAVDVVRGVPTYLLARRIVSPHRACLPPASPSRCPRWRRRHGHDRERLLSGPPVVRVRRAAPRAADTSAAARCSQSGPSSS